MFKWLAERRVRGVARCRHVDCTGADSPVSDRTQEEPKSRNGSISDLPVPGDEVSIDTNERSDVAEAFLDDDGALY